MSETPRFGLGRLLRRGNSFAKLGSAAVNLLLALVAILVAGLLGEVAVRQLFAKGFVDLPSSLFMPHPVFGRVMVPNQGPLRKVTSELSFQVETNSDGLRDVEIGGKTAGVKRILALGDSFTWGDGVNLEESYVKQLERLLNARCEGTPRYRVINAGIPEWGPAQMWLYLQREAVRFKPDLVLLALFDLDVYRNGPYLGIVFDSVSGPGPDIPRRSRLSSLKLWMLRHSRLYNLVAAHLVESPTVNAWLERTGIRAPKPREFAAANSGYVDRVLKENERILSMARDFARGRGMKFLAAYIPTASQVEAIANSKAVDESVAGMMRSAFRDDPASLIDLSFSLAAANGGVYYPWDGHWTAKGHRVAAEVLLPRVLQAIGPC